MLRNPVAVSFITVVLLAGCGSSDETEARTIEEIVGRPLTAEELNNSVQAEWMLREEYVAECMQADGFEYIPWVIQSSSPTSPESLGLSDLEYAKEFGFGISTVLTIEPEFIPNPNDEIYTALDPNVQQLYDLALHGPPSDEEYAISEVSDATSGADNCEQYAYDRFVPDDPPSAETMQTYHELLQDINEQTLADARVMAANNESIRCMRTAGFDLAEDQSSLDLLLGEAAKTFGIEDVSLVAMQGSVPPDTIAEIQAFERSLATTEHGCFDETNSITDTVRSEIAEQVVQDNYAVFVDAARGLRQNTER